MKRNFSKVGGLTMGQDAESMELAVCLDRCEGIVPCRLFLVTVSRPFEGKHPIVNTYYVLAPDEQEAIGQVESNAFPDAIGGHAELALRQTLTCTATPLPLHVRGWGRDTF